MVSPESWGLIEGLDPARYVSGMILEAVVAVISLVFWILMVIRAKKKHKRLMGTLAVAYLGFLWMLLATLTEKVLVVAGVVNYSYITFTVKIGVIGSLGAFVFAIAYSRFIYTVFYLESQKYRLAFRAIYFFLTAVVLYGLALLAMPTSQDLFEILFLPITVILILSLIFLTVLAGIESAHIANKLDVKGDMGQKLARLSLKAISVNAWLILIYIVLFGIDLALPALSMSALYFVAWSCMGISFIFSYVGYFQPEFIKNWLQKRGP